MNAKRRTLSAAHINGGTEMRRLVIRAREALERAELTDAAQLVQQRLFSRDPATIVERDEQNTESWRFKPMAELLLLELIDIATATGASPTDRRNRVEWALAMSGF